LSLYAKALAEKVSEETIQAAAGQYLWGAETPVGPNGDGMSMSSKVAKGALVFHQPADNFGPGRSPESSTRLGIRISALANPTELCPDYKTA